MGLVTRLKSIQMAGSATISKMAELKYTSDFDGVSATPDNEAQISEVGVYIGAHTDDATYTITINGTDFSYAAVSSTSAQVATELETAINAGAEPVTAVAVDNKITISADVAGVAFTITTNSEILILRTVVRNGINEIVAYMVGATNEAAMGALLDAAETPTCTSSLLAITVNFGTHIVNDLTNIVADADFDSTVLVCLYVDDITGDPEVLVFLKTTESEYASAPAGKTFAAHLKQYGLVAAGTALIEEINFIGAEQ